MNVSIDPPLNNKQHLTEHVKSKSIPWVEKYRPSHYQDIILEPINKQIFSTILKKGTFPNLLLYGPPGTGKTTTIINMGIIYSSSPIFIILISYLFFNEKININRFFGILISLIGVIIIIININTITIIIYN